MGEGIIDISLLGLLLGSGVGILVLAGPFEGSSVVNADGDSLAEIVGDAVGFIVGTNVGAAILGKDVGNWVGMRDSQQPERSTDLSSKANKQLMIVAALEQQHIHALNKTAIAQSSSLFPGGYGFQNDSIGEEGPLFF
jgi:hypothetical protein